MNWMTSAKKRIQKKKRLPQINHIFTKTLPPKYNPEKDQEILMPTSIEKEDGISHDVILLEKASKRLKKTIQGDVSSILNKPLDSTHQRDPLEAFELSPINGSSQETSVSRQSILFFDDGKQYHSHNNSSGSEDFHIQLNNMNYDEQSNSMKSNDSLRPRNIEKISLFNGNLSFSKSLY